MEKFLELEYSEKVPKELFDTGVFHCATCNKLMIPTAWLGVAERNVCTACRDKQVASNPSTVFIRNPALNTILQKLKLMLPCENHQNGCKELLEYPAYEDHVRKCPHVPTECPYINITCNWKGTVADVEEHFQEKHSEMIPPENDGTFTISCRKRDTDKTYMLQTVIGRYFLATGWSADRFNVRLVPLEVLPGVNTVFYYQLSLSPGKTFRQKCETIDRDPDVTELYVDTMPDTFPMQVVYNLIDHSLMPKSILSCFVCSDCEEYIKTDMLSCCDDHQICKGCFDIKGTHSNTGSRCVKSNRVLAVLAAECLLPCRYSRFGCRYHVPLGNDHERWCRNRHLKCPFKPECAVFVKAGELLVHLRAAHCHIRLLENGQITTFNLKDGNSISGIIFAYGEAFQVNFTTYYESSYAYRCLKWSIKQLTGKGGEKHAVTVHTCTKSSMKAFSETFLCGPTVDLSSCSLVEYKLGASVLCHIKVTRLAKSE